MYICAASPNCFMLLRQLMARAFSRACANTGKRMAARIAIMAITTRSSIRVKALLSIRMELCLLPESTHTDERAGHSLPALLAGGLLPSRCHNRIPHHLHLRVPG